MAQSVVESMTTRRIGEAEITICYESTGIGTPHFNVPDGTLRRAVPELADDGTLPSALTSTIVRLGDAIIVIDPALDDPDSRLDRRMSARSTAWTRGAGLQAALEALGIANAEVTHVVITHAHFDHCLGVTIEQRDGVFAPRFPNARYFMSEAEWEQAPDPAATPPSPKEDSFGYLHVAEMWPRLRAVRDAGLLELVAGSRQIAAGVDLVHAPGETPGHCVVRIESGGEVFYHLGDLVHAAFEFEHPGWITVDTLPRDAGTMEATRLQLMPRIAGENALAFYGHAPHPGWGRLVPHDGGFRWEPA
jgi:glyoxylase-like metal-dependent hydrolase (beta-lactamase superfamily II)